MNLRRFVKKMQFNLKLITIRKQRIYSITGLILTISALLCFVYFKEDSISIKDYPTFFGNKSHVKISQLAVFVLSHRDAFSRRETIRKTWASQHEHVYFVVSEHYCKYPPEYRVTGTCKRNNNTINEERDRQNIDEEEARTYMLRNESNVVLMPVKDVSEELTDMIKESYNWAIKNLKAKWILHVKDSFNVKVDTFENFLDHNLDANKNTIMFLQMQCTNSVKRESSQKYLSPFEYLLNHVVSRGIVEFLSFGLSEIFSYKETKNSTSMRVLKSPHLKSVRRVDLDMMTIAGGDNTAAIVLDVCIEYKMNNCVDGVTYSMSENPSLYLHSERFDLIVKMVYAYFYVFEKQVPSIIREAYLEHIRVWNQFHEECAMKDVWFDSKFECKEKTSSSDFLSSFHKTIQSVKKNGFNPNMSKIPVDARGFINNGAHRLASSVILSKNASFEHHTYEENSHWGYEYFKGLGMSEKSFDLVLVEWMRIQLKLKDLKSSVSIVSIFSNDNSKDKIMRNIVKKRCSKDNGILYEKVVNFTRNGARHLISHMYGEQPWLETKIQQMLSRFSGKTCQVLFLFVYTKPSTDLVKCKYEIRKLYNDKIFKSTAHIPDTLDENLILAEMVLNPNSIQFLNYAKNADDCKLVAKEIGVRSNDVSIKTLPGLYAGRNDIMIDSGSVLGFFDLRKRTDVDLLFLHDIDKSILGKNHEINIQAHAFKFNSNSKERPWGEDHFSPKGTRNQWDLFYDPDNYGYCYGIKFVSLKQLVRYKIQRNEPKKDSYDVNLINDFLNISNKCTNYNEMSLSLLIFYVFCIYLPLYLNL